jgi:hypothetical protein
MRQVILLVFVALTTSGLSQEHSHLSRRFTLSESPRPFPILDRQLELTFPPTAPTVSQPAATTDISALTGSGPFQIQTDSYMQTRMDAACARLERMERDGFVFYPAQTPDSPIVNAMNAVFEPEVFHIGKISASASVLTAIKRKNPLCLLSPAVLTFSW